MITFGYILILVLVLMIVIIGLGLFWYYKATPNDEFDRHMSSQDGNSEQSIVHHGLTPNMHISSEGTHEHSDISSGIPELFSTPKDVILIY